MGRKSIKITKNPSKGVQWYEKYRVTDKEELKKANEIWQKILEEDISLKKSEKILVNNKHFKCAVIRKVQH